MNEIRIPNDASPECSWIKKEKLRVNRFGVGQWRLKWIRAVR